MKEQDSNKSEQYKILYRDEMRKRISQIASLESQLREKEEHYRKLEVVANRWHNEYLRLESEKDKEIERLKEDVKRLESMVRMHQILKNQYRDIINQINDTGT